MVSYVVDIALSVTHLGKVIRGHFELVIGILNFAFKYGPDRIEQKQLMDMQKTIHFVLHFIGSMDRKKSDVPTEIFSQGLEKPLVRE